MIRTATNGAITAVPVPSGPRAGLADHPFTPEPSLWITRIWF